MLFFFVELTRQPILFELTLIKIIYLEKAPEFEKKNKHLNFIFSNGINFIHEFFNFGKKSKNEKINRLLKFVGNNKFINNIIMKYVDKGLIF